MLRCPFRRCRLRFVASCARGNQDASGGHDWSGALADRGGHCHLSFDPRGARGDGMRRARAAVGDSEEVHRTFREENVKKSAVHCLVELKEPPCAVERAEGRAARGDAGSARHE
eukprot:372842-Pleurochrysis_carterae.AAC.1